MKKEVKNQNEPIYAQPPQGSMKQAHFLNVLLMMISIGLAVIVFAFIGIVFFSGGSWEESGLIVRQQRGSGADNRTISVTVTGDSNADSQSNVSVTIIGPDTEATTE
jgi:hypothetical protein